MKNILISAITTIIVITAFMVFFTNVIEPKEPITLSENIQNINTNEQNVQGITIDNNKSIFVKEVEADYKELIKNDKELMRNIYKCPKCGGRLIPRKGPYGSFFGCSNYPECKFIKKY